MNGGYWEEEAAVAEFPPSLDELPGIRELVSEQAWLRGVPPQRIRDIELAVSEACVNAIQHSGEAGGLRLEIYAYEDQFVVEITHDGEFKPLAAVMRDATHRGFGLPLMVALADGFTFSRFRSGGTRVVLSFRRDSPRARVEGA